MAAALVTGVAVHYGGNKGDVPANTKTMTYIVAPGESEWSIIEQYDKRDDPRKARDWIDQRNGLTSDELQPGQELVIPVGR
ncbi:LysM peptidoglycan-binding domain-containing protein [Alicyclobacillus dauci]|uniref:LysM peptidoglycan-binding domain-containing protein n=1 Tax=Alicyclobacillus dauci TaxID=1475485 RepID=A0ABY6YX06_9BACL|nr:LysM peptidoglycan-binding domain-containing protein [Alicyclobacillus dauci]WAH35011.1 LysM peptidoglycan-binding domain-containing protein [Alicyclobacillus dauci]